MLMLALKKAVIMVSSVALKGGLPGAGMGGGSGPGGEGEGEGPLPWKKHQGVSEPEPSGTQQQPLARHWFWSMPAGLPSAQNESGQSARRRRGHTDIAAVQLAWVGHVAAVGVDALRENGEKDGGHDGARREGALRLPQHCKRQLGHSSRPFLVQTKAL
jgi:hypothetical protein